MYDSCAEDTIVRKWSRSNRKRGVMTVNKRLCALPNASSTGPCKRGFESVRRQCGCGRGKPKGLGGKESAGGARGGKNYLQRKAWANGHGRAISQKIINGRGKMCEPGNGRRLDYVV